MLTSTVLLCSANICFGVRLPTGTLALWFQQPAAPGGISEQVRALAAMCAAMNLTPYPAGSWVTTEALADFAGAYPGAAKAGLKQKGKRQAFRPPSPGSRPRQNRRVARFRGMLAKGTGGVASLDDHHSLTRPHRGNLEAQPPGANITGG
jgi:hypothetical protein